jgi:hypothetical protein
MSDSYTFTICSPDWCLVFRNETWSQKLTDKTTSSLNTHPYVWLLWHFTLTYYRPHCITDNRHFLLLRGLNLYYFCKLKVTVDEWTVQQKIFVLPNRPQYLYLVQAMKSTLKRLYQQKHCSNSSGTYCGSLYNYGVVFNTSPQYTF